jgi:arylsulfatase A-like enzyme
LANQPRALRHLREHNFKIDHDSVVHLPDPTPEQRRRQRAFYLGNVTLIDEQVGRLLATLERRGYLENAVVIFTSDHGDCLTDHGHSQKWTMYEEIVRVPTVIRMPDGRGGNQIDAMVQSMDLGPMVLELAGLKPPAWMEARSLLPALQDPAGFAGRDYVIAAHGRDGILDGTDMMMMIRDHRWKLVTFIDHDDGQLFDLEHDPRELTNRWCDPAPEAAAAKTRLREALLQQLMLSQYHTRTWAEAAR